MISLDKFNIKDKKYLQNKIKSLLDFFKKDDFFKAEIIAKEIINNYPQNSLSYKILVSILKRTGRSLQSIEISNKLIKLFPNDPESYYNLGNTYKELRIFNEAIYNYKQAILLKQNYAVAHNNLGNTFKELRKFNESINSYKLAILYKPDYSKAYYNLGLIYQDIEKYDQAISSFNNAISIKSDYEEAYNNLGVIYQELGRFDQALENFYKAISIRSDYAEVHRHISLLKKFLSKDKQYLLMQKIYDDNNTKSDQLCHINFALAKASEDLGDYSKAYKHYTEGNSIRKKLLNYDINNDKNIFKQIKASFKIIKKYSISNINNPSKIKPVFIFGMPRSGTTLVEQIVSSHSLVNGAGELSIVAKLGDKISRGIKDIDSDVILEFRKNFLSELKNISNGKLIITDKTPQNFCYIGLILASLPEAKLIHVTRDPSAVCWSIYKQYFVSNSLSFSYNLDDIIEYFDLYSDLMKFWSKFYKERIYNINYDFLTTNHKKEIKNLINQIELEWDEKCLNPENNSRPVLTASNTQVRKKIYSKSSMNWEKYKYHLKGKFDLFKNYKV